jgi:DMSO/TMAO reductase YedYZ molybdopterin-dependent catalytic subunit
MLIPDIYGMKNAKWVTNITLIADENFKGYWEQQGWDNTATIQTESSITSPTNNQSVTAGQVNTLRGYAFAGQRGIQKIELSTDGGLHWNNVTFKEPLSRNSWVLWHYDWTPATAASYNLVVRATDKTGEQQVAKKADSYPAGATGWHSITVTAQTAKV